jgi:hypothetical protein
MSVDKSFKYGIRYMGSKRSLAGDILEVIYKTLDCDDFVVADLFGGGGSFTLLALNQGHKVLYNEFDPAIVDLFNRLLSNGEFYPYWISREDYSKYKDQLDWFGGWVKICYSFGTNQKSYAFGKKIEHLKKLSHNFIVDLNKDFYDMFDISVKECLMSFFDEVDYENLNLNDRRLFLKRGVKHCCKSGNIRRFDIENIERTQNIKNIQHILDVKNLFKKFNDNIIISNKSYEDVDLPSNTVVYCDIPYKNTHKYNDNVFDYDSFYSWAFNNSHPVFISEYSIPDDFKCVWEKAKTSGFSINNNTKTLEKLFWNGVSHV